MDNQLQSLNTRQQRSAARDEQRHHFRRNQAIGVLIVALAVLIYRLLHTPSGWIFPAGWWRLW